ncbi:hypothetical protein LOS20_15270 [Enterococcus faecium]|nr:hypothetical protein [Enterococcus faecium]
MSDRFITVKEWNNLDADYERELLTADKSDRKKILDKLVLAAMGAWLQTMKENQKSVDGEIETIKRELSYKEPEWEKRLRRR